MNQSSIEIPTQQGYAPPSVTQFSVFLDNRVGKLYDLVESFENDPVTQICALSVHEASDHAVVRIITNSSNATKSVLRDHRLAFSETEVLVVEVTQGHTLATLCLHLLAAELNIRFAYPLMLRPNGTPTIALAVDDLTLGGQILRRKGFRLMGEADLPQPSI